MTVRVDTVWPKPSVATVWTGRPCASKYVDVGVSWWGIVISAERVVVQHRSDPVRPHLGLGLERVRHLLEISSRRRWHSPGIRGLGAAGEDARAPIPFGT